MGGSFCGWHGIICDKSGNVVAIHLSGNGLIGTLHPAIFTGLTFLTEFNVANNKLLRGPIPPEIGQALNLCLFEAYGCSLNGQLPDVFDKLTHFNTKYCRQPKLDLHFNDFDGILPSSIGFMDGLPYISVANNKFEAPIPQSWYNLTHLETLGIAYNPGINGTLEIITHLNSLKVLFARHCSLSGSVPVPASSTLAVMDIDFNNFNAIDSSFCSARPTLPALENPQGCDTDWPNQPFGTCCFKNNAFGPSMCSKTGAPPACLKNCQMSCDAPTPAPTPSTCSGQSPTLAPGECAAWHAQALALDYTQWTDCKSSYNDPCRCVHSQPYYYNIYNNSINSTVII
jgi:hypothetical protein